MPLYCKLGRLLPPNTRLSKRRYAGKSQKARQLLEGERKEKKKVKDKKKKVWFSFQLSIFRNIFLSISPGYLVLQETVLPAVNSYLLLRW